MRIDDAVLGRQIAAVQLSVLVVLIALLLGQETADVPSTVSFQLSAFAFGAAVALLIEQHLRSARGPELRGGS
jgi:hypothetical protein